MKYLCFLLFLFSSMNSYSKNNYDNYFNENDAVHKFLEKFHNAHSKEIPIFYYSNNNFSKSIDNISDTWLAYNEIDPSIFKSNLNKFVSMHHKKYPGAYITSQNIILKKPNIQLCVINDKNNLLQDLVLDKNIKKVHLFFVYHEIEHCYINTISSPIFDETEFKSFAPGDINNKSHLYKYYMVYLQEVFSDLSALNYLGNNYEIHSLIMNYRINAANQGDILHDSSMFISDFYLKYKDKKLIRKEIVDYIYFNSLELMPISKFSLMLERNNTIKH